jgi:hypothetical protein
MVKCGVLFEVRTEFLIAVYTISALKYTSDDTREDPVHRPDQTKGPKNEQTTEMKKIIETATANCLSLSLYCTIMCYYSKCNHFY